VRRALQREYANHDGPLNIVAISDGATTIRKSLQYLDKHRHEIIDYGVRQAVGKPIGSGRMEEGLDQVVGHRQKKKGMSWSAKGSKALAIKRRPPLKLRKIYSKKWFWLATLTPALVCAGVDSDSIQNLNLSGSVRGGFWSSSRNLDDETGVAAASVWLKAQPKLAENASLFVEGWVRNDDSLTGGETEELLREAYLDLTLEKIDLRLGKQIIAWGRADRINPTDNLTPRDFTLLVPEIDDERFGSLAARASYYFSHTSFTGIWLPDFAPNRIPLPSSSALVFNERVPESFNQWAMKLERSGGALDWSVSYFDGFDLNPDIGLAGPGSVLLKHNRIRVVGADAAAVIGRYGLRAEAAYVRTEDTSGDNPFVKNPFFFAVFGVERTFYEYLNVNLQYFSRYVSDYRDPEKIADPFVRGVALAHAAVNRELDYLDHGITLRISNKWFNETLEIEVATVYGFNRNDYALRPKVTYAFSDRWKGTAGADFFRGREDSFFGRLRDNSTLYVELRYHF
jgi:hypothetical protein